MVPKRTVERLGISVVVFTSCAISRRWWLAAGAYPKNLRW